MTLAEVLERLSEIPGWRLTPYGCIRLAHPDGHCPLTAMMEPGSKVAGSKAAEQLGMDLQLVRDIMTAVDNRAPEWPKYQHLRSLMLKACGLD